MRRHHRNAWLCASALAVAAAPWSARPALAQATGDAAAAATELFQQGRQALLDGRLDVACAQLAESERLDPKVGTLFNLAQCEQRAGRLARALQRWDEALDLARKTADQRADLVAAQRAELVPRVPQLSIHAKDREGDGARVTVDDGPARSLADLVEPIHVDPGAHVVKVAQSGHADATYSVTLADGATAELEIQAGPALAPSVLSTPMQPASASLQWGGTQHVVAYVSTGLGLASVAVGTVFGAQAISARNDPSCNGGVCSTQADAQTQRNGVTTGNVSTGLFIAGGALLAGGVVLWLTAPRMPAGASPSRSASRPGLAGLVEWVSCQPHPGGALVGVGSSW
jgi:hypothetical protein